MSRALLNPSLSAAPRYATAKTAPRDAVRLASNENPYGASPHVREAVMGSLEGLHRYPDPSGAWLREQLGAHLGLPATQVLVGNGATELLDLVARGVLAPGDNTLYANPSFVMFRIAPMRMGAEVREVPLRPDGRMDLQALLQAVDAKTKLVYLANPNNPTGTYVGRRELLAFAGDLPAHVLLVVDEAYAEYVVAPDFPNGTELFDIRERVAVVRTFSKCHGLAGLRVGYLAAPPTVINAIERARLPFNVNSLAQVAAAAALGDSAHIASCCRRNREEMMWLWPRLQAMGLGVTPSQANFLLVNLGSTDVVNALAQHQVMVRSMSPYGLATSARVTLGTRAENMALCEALTHVLVGRSWAA